MGIIFRGIFVFIKILVIVEIVLFFLEVIIIFVCLAIVNFVNFFAVFFGVVWCIYKCRWGLRRDLINNKFCWVLFWLDMGLNMRWVRVVWIKFLIIIFVVVILIVMGILCIW